MINNSAHLPERKNIFTSLRSFFTAPVFEGDQEKTRSAKLLYQIIAVIWVLPILLVVIMILGGRAEVIPPAIVISITLLTLMVLNRAGWVRLASAIMTGMIILVFGYADFQNAGNIQPSTLIIAIAIIMSGLLLGKRAPLIAAILIAGVHGVIVFLQMQGVVKLTSAPALGPENIVITGILILMIGYLLQFVISRLQSALDEARKNEKELQISNRELEEGRLSLEQRVVERTRNLELAAEVGRSVSQAHSLDVMLTDATELIRKQFDLYYVQVYLTDPNQTYLNLQAGTGNVGTELLGRVHRLPLNTDSINGRAAVEKKSVVISDISTSATFKPNPLLPNTRSEMAVPLMLGNKVVGVLDMQSEQAGTLSTDILSAFEALAGQLAIAIQNANFLAEVQQARAEVEAQARRLTRANWVDYLDAVHKPEEAGYMFERNTITPFVQTGEVANNALSAPISITGETIGNLVVEMEGQSPIARTDELLNTVARQVAQQIENLRLLDSAERFRYEAELASRRLTHEGWEDYMNTNAGAGLSYIYDLKEVRPYNQDKSQQTEGTANSLPIKVRDETIGKLIVQGLKADDSEGLELANAVAGRLGAHLESLRLSKQTEQALTATRKQALREQALRQITSVVRGSTDPTTILRSAARELGNILGRQTIVRLATQGSAPAADQENEPIPPAESPNAVGGDK